jgi:vitamin B12 transporter
MDQFHINNELFASVGIRYDQHEKFGGTFTYRIALSDISWKTGTKIKATVGTGFKAPSIFYLYDPAFGNENLNPEKNFGWDAGVEQFLWSDGIAIGANCFLINFTDMFGTDENFKTINIEEAVISGIEIFSKLVLMNDLELKINYTYTNSKDKSESSPDYNQKLIRRPKHKASLFVNSDITERANVNLEVIYVGERDDKNFSLFPAERIILESYALINIAGHYDLFEILRIFGRVENLLNTEYEEIYGFARPELSAYGGIRIKL